MMKSTVKADGIIEILIELINRGNSPEKIGQAADMSSTAIYSIINKGGRIRLANVARIADAFGYDYERIGDDVRLWKKQEREPSQALSPSALEIIQLMEQLTDKQREQFIALVRGIWRTVKDGALGTY